MLITLFKYKKRCQRGGCAVVVLVLSMVGWFFTPASAEEECATDFFSQKTCRSFDTPDRDKGQNSDAQKALREPLCGTITRGFPAVRSGIATHLMATGCR